MSLMTSLFLHTDSQEATAAGVMSSAVSMATKASADLADPMDSSARMDSVDPMDPMDSSARMDSVHPMDPAAPMDLAAVATDVTPAFDLAFDFV